jgi:hypothetical protein
MNAGDLLSRQSAPGGSNQVKGAVGPGQTRYTRGARPSQGGGVWPGDGASGNQHWVYDSSDYIKYKKMSAVNKNYNDIGFGGAGLSGVGVGQSMFKIAGRNNPDGKRNSSYPYVQIAIRLIREYFAVHRPDHTLCLAGQNESIFADLTGCDCDYHASLSSGKFVHLGSSDTASQVPGLQQHIAYVNSQCSWIKGKNCTGKKLGSHTLALVPTAAIEGLKGCGYGRANWEGLGVYSSCKYDDGNSEGCEGGGFK